MIYKLYISLLSCMLLFLTNSACNSNTDYSIDALVDETVTATKSYVNEPSDDNLNVLVSVFAKLKQDPNGLKKLGDYQEKSDDHRNDDLNLMELSISSKTIDNTQFLSSCGRNTYGELLASSKIVDSLVDHVMKDYFVAVKNQLACSNSVVWGTDRFKDENNASRLKFFSVVVQISPELVNDFKKDNDFKEDVVLQVLQLLPDEKDRLAVISAMIDSNKSEVFQEEAKHPSTYDNVISKLVIYLPVTDQKNREDIVTKLAGPVLPPPPPIDYVVKLATEHGVNFTKMQDDWVGQVIANFQEVVDLVHTGDANMGFPASPTTTEAEIKSALKTLSDSLDEYKSLGLPKFFYPKNNTPTSLNARFKIGRVKMEAMAGSIDWMHELDQVGAGVMGYTQATHALPLSFYEGVFNDIVLSHVLDKGDFVNLGKVVVGGVVLGDTTRYTEGGETAYNDNSEAKKNSIRSFLMTLANKSNNGLNFGSVLKLNNFAGLHDQNFAPEPEHRDLYNELSYKLFRIVEEIRKQIALNNTVQEKFDRWKILAEPLLHAGEHCANAKSNSIDDAYRGIAITDYQRLFGGLMTSAVGDANKILQLTAFIKESLLKEAVEKVLVIPAGQPDAGKPVYEAASKRVKTWNTLAPLIGLNNKSGPEYLNSSINSVDFMLQFLGNGNPGNGTYTPEKLLTELIKKPEFNAMVKTSMGDLFPLMRHYEDRVSLERFLAIALLVKHGFLEKK